MTVRSLYILACYSRRHNTPLFPTLLAFAQHVCCLCFSAFYFSFQTSIVGKRFNLIANIYKCDGYRSTTQSFNQMAIVRQSACQSQPVIKCLVETVINLQHDRVHLERVRTSDIAKLMMLAKDQ